MYFVFAKLMVYCMYSMFADCHHFIVSFSVCSLSGTTQKKILEASEGISRPVCIAI